MEELEYGDYLTSDEVALILGIKRRSLYKKLERKELPYYRVSRRCIVFKKQDILDFLEERHIASAEQMLVMAEQLLAKMEGKKKRGARL